MIYCAFDPLNIPKDPNTNEDIHVCKNYGSFLCAECPSRYDGDRKIMRITKKMMED